MVARMVDGVDFGQLLERSDQAFLCRRAQRRLRAALVLNLLQAAALAGLLWGWVFTSGSKRPRHRVRPLFFWKGNHEIHSVI